MNSSIIWPPQGPRRVPSKVYTDTENYRKELEVIFKGSTWNYVALSCEVKDKGDFIQSYIGETPVIVARDKNGNLQVMINRCIHRGAKICHKTKGNTKLFVCPYHEWSFGLDGKLSGIPYKNGVDGKGGMPPDFDSRKHNLKKLNVAERHGVIFASYSYEIESIEEYLGKKIIKYFDRVCDGRELKVIGKMRHVVDSNWKLQIENVKDSVHAGILHSFFKVFGIWRPDQETRIIIDSSGKNSLLLSTASFKRPEANGCKERVGDFSLEEPELISHKKEFAEGTGAVMTIWPNLIFLQQLNCLVMRHVRPDGPYRCIKTWTFFGYANEPEELTQHRISQANLLGPSGMVTIDDNEILAMTQDGILGSEEVPSVLEVGAEEGDTDYMVTESAIRGFYRYYKNFMGID